MKEEEGTVGRATFGRSRIQWPRPSLVFWRPATVADLGWECETIDRFPMCTDCGIVVADSFVTEVEVSGIVPPGVLSVDDGDLLNSVHTAFVEGNGTFVESEPVVTGVYRCHICQVAFHVGQGRCELLDTFDVDEAQDVYWRALMAPQSYLGWVWWRVRGGRRRLRAAQLADAARR